MSFAVFALLKVCCSRVSALYYVLVNQEQSLYTQVRIYSNSSVCTGQANSESSCVYVRSYLKKPQQIRVFYL